MWSFSPSLTHASSTLVRSSNPSVCVLGWLGAAEKHLKNYIQLNNELGYDVFHYTSPMSAINSQTAFLKQAENLADELSRLAEPPFRIHALSNNGAYTYACMAKFLPEHFIQSVILDSGPSFLTPEIFARGFTGALCGLFKITPVNYQQPLIYPTLRYLYHHLLKTGSTMDKSIKTLHEAMHEIPVASTDYLFLYSNADRLIPASDIELFSQELKIRASSKSRIILHDFQHSDHVLHLRTFPSEYRDIVRRFWRPQG